jgi:DNA (cytosine-5)-methyltransferase 1
MTKILPRRVLDLFCGAGGAAMGLHRAWPEAKITGIDIKPQKNYPFNFVQADAMTFDLDGYDFIWASPPCQAFTALRTMPNAKQHLDLLTPTRERLRSQLYVIENVEGAPMFPPVTILCGTMFGLQTKDGIAELRRHRIFETSFTMGLTPPCNHNGHLVIGVYGGHGRDRRRSIGVYGDSAGISHARKRAIAVTGNAGGFSNRDGLQGFSTEQRREAMGIPWMNGNELSQAIPPAYSEFIARQVPSL